MFSASTDSSQKAKSFGTSFDSPESRKKTSITPEDWPGRKDSLEPSSPPSDESGKKGNLSRLFGTSKSEPTFEATFSMERSTTSGLGPDGQEGLRLRNDAWSTSSESRETGANRYIDPGVSISSTPEEPFHFEAPDRKSAPIRHTLTPQSIKAQATASSARNLLPGKVALPPEEVLDDSPNYVGSDFRAIDPSAYRPKSPYSWSALPLIAHAIALDLESGQACGQFSAHLLMHVFPFFFDHR